MPEKQPEQDFCFVHAADLHIGGRRWLRAEPEDASLAERVKCADHLALSALIDLCLREGARLLLCAGDILDGWCRSYLGALRLVEQLERLADHDCEVVMVLGNHDVRSRMLGSLLLPKGAYVLGRRGPETLLRQELGVALHGWSAPETSLELDVASLYPSPVPGLFNIGLLHTSAEGRGGHANYAPCSRLTLRHHGYDYWALGHVHAREVVAENPWIVFPGNLQGRGNREAGSKGATLVRVGGGRVRSVEHQALDAVRFETIAANLGELDHFDDLLSLAQCALDEIDTQAVGRPVVARLVLQGVAAASCVLRVPAERRRRAFWQLARRAASESLWIDEIWIDTGSELGAWPIDRAA